MFCISRKGQVRKMRYVITILIAVLCTGFAGAAQYNVPSSDFATIQQAINACTDGDRVVIAEGTFSGFGNINVSFRGKAITVRSVDPDDPAVVAATVIDVQKMGSGFAFFSGEGQDSVLEGVTIINANGIMGGGIYCLNSSPTIRNCVIADNTAIFSGGGIFCDKSSPAIVNCRITGNNAGTGGGLYAIMGAPRIVNCLFEGNTASQAGAMQFWDADGAVVINSTVVGNAASNGSAVNVFGESRVSLTNSLFRGNVASQGALVTSTIRVAAQRGGARTLVAYCNVDNFDTNVTADAVSTVELGLGNMDEDPMLVLAGALDLQGVYTQGDLHLQRGSPCIDAGDPGFIALPGQTDMDGQARVSGTAVDIGADEVMMAVLVKLKVMPDKLKLDNKSHHRDRKGKDKDKGKGNDKDKRSLVTCVVNFGRDYDMDDVDMASILLNGELTSKHMATAHHRLVLRFEREDVIALAEAGDAVLKLTVSGTFKDGSDWIGTDTVKLRYKKDQHLKTDNKFKR